MTPSGLWMLQRINAAARACFGCTKTAWNAEYGVQGQPSGSKPEIRQNGALAVDNETSQNRRAKYRFYA